jgi:hypothetical protein
MFFERRTKRQEGERRRTRVPSKFAKYSFVCGQKKFSQPN